MRLKKDLEIEELSFDQILKKLIKKIQLFSMLVQIKDSQ